MGVRRGVAVVVTVVVYVFFFVVPSVVSVVWAVFSLSLSLLLLCFFGHEMWDVRVERRALGELCRAGL